ncbi:hypothetical protein Tco_0788704 [Tanacetum coccineum]
MSNLKFAETHNLVAFLEKPEESDGFKGIIDFLNVRKSDTKLVDGKKVIVTETSVRRALQLKDAEGTECLPNATIFTELEIIGAKTTAGTIFSCTMAQLSSVLATTKNFTFTCTFSNNMAEELWRVGVKFLMYPRENEKSISLMRLANEEHRVLDLENKDLSSLADIAKLKEKVKKLEKRNKSRTSGFKRLRNVGRTARIESSEDECLGVFDDQEVEVKKVVSTAEVTTASATTTTVDELTLAHTLIEIKAAKPKDVTTATTISTTVVTRPTARGVVKDKGKAKMIEPEKPLKTKDQILVDEEISQSLENCKLELEEEKELMDKDREAFCKALEMKRLEETPQPKPKRGIKMLGYSFVPMDMRLWKENEKPDRRKVRKEQEKKLESENQRSKRIDANKK